MVSDSTMYRRRIKEQEPKRYAQYLAKQSAAIKSRREREKKLPLTKARELLLEKRRARQSECTARYRARKRSGQPIRVVHRKRKDRKCVKEMTDEERREHVRRLRAESRARQSDERKQSLREWNREYARRKRAQTRVAKSTYLSDSPQSLPMAFDSDVENYQVKPEIEFDRDDSSLLKTEFDLHESLQLETEFLHNESPQVKTELHIDLKNEFFQDDSSQLKTDYLQDLSPEIQTEFLQEKTGSHQKKSPQPETELSVVRSQELKNELSLNDSLQGRTKIFLDMSPSQLKTKLPQNESQKPEFRVREHVRYKTGAPKRANKSNSLVAPAAASPPHTTSAANVQKDQKLKTEFSKDHPHCPSFMHHRSHQQHMFHQHLQKDHVDSSPFRESPEDMIGKRTDLMGSIMVSDSTMYRRRIKEQEPERYAQYLAKQSAASKTRREREKKLPMTKARKLLLEERRVRQNERTARYRARKMSGQPIMVQVRKQRTCLKNKTNEERREHKRRLRAESRARQSDEKRLSIKKKNTEYSRWKRAQSKAANSAPHTDLPQFLPTVFAMEVENKQEPKTEFDIDISPQPVTEFP